MNYLFGFPFSYLDFISGKWFVFLRKYRLMEKDYAFLPHFINEEIFIIKEDLEKYTPGKGVSSVSETVAKASPLVSAEIAHPAKAASTEIRTAGLATVKEAPAEKASAATADESLATSKHDPEKEAETEIFYKGKNLKKVAIIVNYNGKGFIDPQEEEFLLKILSAVKLTADDVAIINVNHLNSGSHIKNFNYVKLITFGCHNDDLPNAAEPPYSLKQSEGRFYLKADSLEEIQQTKDKKVKLWESLQKMFSV